MTLSEAKKQTLLLTLINGVVRALGLMMRVMLSRVAGAEVMGVMELAQSVHMVAIAPVTSGLPAAVTRLTAKAKESEKQLPLQAGFWITRWVSFLLVPLLWLLSPLIAHWMGDTRVLPSLWFTAPCVLVLGYSACCNGYCYGVEKSLIPAASELLEQVVRVGGTLAACMALHHLTAGWLAAVPAAAMLIAEWIGLIYALRALRLPSVHTEASARYRRPLLELACPSTVNRLFQTLLRSFTAILIPIRLQQSGLSTAEATSRLGMLNGMVMPILMLPCIFTSALSMVAMPKIAKAEEKPSAFRRLMGKCLLGSFGFSLLCAAVIAWGAPFLSARVYRLPELSALFRSCAALTVLTAVGHVLSTALTALGRQKSLLWISGLTSVVSLFLTWLWTGDPALRINGVVRSQMVGAVLTILLSALRIIKG